MSIFDSIAAAAFDTTTSIMGYTAEWHQKDGPVLTAKVHFKDPSSMVKLGGKEYDPQDGVIEYKRGDFPGLRELANKNEPERIKITMHGSVHTFETVKDKKLFDGQTIQVKLMKTAE